MIGGESGGNRQAHNPLTRPVPRKCLWKGLVAVSVSGQVTERGILP